MKIALNTLMIFFSSIVFSQTTNEKIISILKSNGNIEGYKSIIIDMTINPLKYSADKKDSLILEEIEKKLSEQEIEKRLSKAFSEVYTESEINDIYNFYNSNSGKKFLISFDILDEKFRNSFQDIDNELKPIIDKTIVENQKEAEENKEMPIPTDKEDGFYTIINSDERDIKLKNLKLSKNPEITKSEILEIYSSFDDLGRSIINIKLTKEGAKKFKILTENNIGKPIAIILNKMLISAPYVSGVIPNGRIQISGNFSIEEAQNFVNSFNK